MEEKNRTIEFEVTVILGPGDGGSVMVETEVTPEEYELLKQCERDGGDIEEYEGLEDLTERLCAEARDEDEFCSSGSEDGEDEEDGDDYDPYESAYYTIAMPDEIWKAVSAEDDAAE